MKYIIEINDNSVEYVQLLTLYGETKEMFRISALELYEESENEYSTGWELYNAYQKAKEKYETWKKQKDKGMQGTVSREYRLTERIPHLYNLISASLA